MRPSDLWDITLGELNDLICGWHYEQYLISYQNAQLASWVLSAVCQKPPKPEELVGYWYDGEIVTKEERYQRQKKRILQKRTREVDE